jgi:uncharacterized RDD family membrane protein YckC
MSFSFDTVLGGSDTFPDPAANPELLDGVLWRRVVAFAVDVVILGLAFGLVLLVLTVLTVVSFGLLSPLLLLLPSFSVLVIAYHALLIGGPASATLGMQLFDLEVRTWSGGKPGYIQAAAQSLLFYATIAATGSLILVVALLNARRRAVHDFLAGTVVVRRVVGPEILPPPSRF